jgi:hypothetical protein
VNLSNMVEYIEPFAKKALAVFEQINLHMLDPWWLTLLAGILFCFFGITIFNASVFWFGALFGGAVGYGLGSVLFDYAGGVVLAIIFAIVCAYLLRELLKIGIFVAGLLVGGLVGTNFLGNSLWIIPIIIASGISSLVFFKYFIMISTAVWGAILLTGCITAFKPSMADKYYVVLTCFECMAILFGVLYQASNLKRDKSYVKENA